MLRYRLLVAVIGLPIGLAAVILGGYFLLGLALVLDRPRPARVLHPAPALPAQPAGGLRAGLARGRRARSSGAPTGCWSGWPP